MSPADLTLEDIAADETPLGTFSGEIQAVLAREIIALRERFDGLFDRGDRKSVEPGIDLEVWLKQVRDGSYCPHPEEVLADAILTLIESSDEHCHRLDQLESQARPFQESGELAVGREDDGEIETPPILIRLATEQSRDRAIRHAQRAEAERDAAIARADEAERDLVEAVATTKTTATARDEYYRRFKSVEAERDAAREALRKIADPNIGLKYVRIIAKDALDGSGQHE